MTDPRADARAVGLPERIFGLVRRNGPLAALDLAIVFAAYLIPLSLRFEGDVPTRYWDGFLAFLPSAVLAHIIANYLFGLYGQIWRHASVQEARRVVLANCFAGIAVFTLNLWGEGSRTVPLSVLLMGIVLSLIGGGAIRFQSRLFAVRRRTVDEVPARVLIVGAGDAGSMVLKDLMRDASAGLDAVGFVDDDPSKRGLSLHGVHVLGDRHDIPALVSKHRVDQVLLAIPSGTNETVREIASLCEQASVTMKVLPSVREIVGGRVSARDIRDLRIEDLLGRQQVSIDMGAVESMLRGRRVLVTGAGGSIGSELVRQISTFEPSALMLLDHDETHLHDLQTELDAPTEMVLADIRERGRLMALFSTLRPDVVFHAAAHKHVPILETHAEEAVLTNVIGTANVADAAAKAGTERFVLISTDKAVRPASVMGASKWFAEQIVRSLHTSSCVYTAVRFGNVLGSRGSVIPTFLRQIQRGGPVTVTDPSMTRYFMSAQEAVLLVLQAAALSRGGEVFTLDMGEPVNILELARRLIRLSGRIPDRDVKVAIVGTRPGEKLHEELVDSAEEQVPSAHPALMVSRPPVPDPRSMRTALRELEMLAAFGQVETLAARIKVLANTVDADTGTAPVQDVRLRV